MMDNPGRMIEDGYLVQPKNTLPQITELWAFVSVDPRDGNEGLIGMPTPHGMSPMICADKERLACLAPLAKRLARDFYPDCTVKLIRLSNRQVVIEDVRRDGLPDDLTRHEHGSCGSCDE